MYSPGLESFQPSIQIPTHAKCKTSKACTEMGSNSLTRGISSGNQEFGASRILKPIREVTKLVNSFIIVEKKANPHAKPDHSSRKKLRICLDPRDLNAALEHEPYYTRSIKEILGKFHGMTHFTIVDFNKGYWMVEVHPESRKLTMMALDIGQLQWTCLPMGSVMVKDVFQRKLDALFLNVPGVTGIADDMTVYGRTDKENDRNLLNFLEVCQKNNLMLNPDKMQFCLLKVSFFGHTWSDKGLTADPKKIRAVKKMEIPQDVEMMQSFLGLINYLNWLSPHLAKLRNLLRQICRQMEEFKLTEECEDVFHRCNEEISKNMTLPYFNPKSPTTLQIDTSKKGLGAMLLQNSTPVMFASRALTGAEKNYQNLEQECLATIWGMEKFHYFLHSKQFTLKMDQKPLVAIYKKYIVEMSPRIQHLVVQSFPYQPFDVQYQRGVEIPLDNTLSRVTPLLMEEDGIHLPIIVVNLIMVNIPCSSNDLDQICEETREDMMLKLLKQYISNGWPHE